MAWRQQPLINKKNYILTFYTLLSMKFLQLNVKSVFFCKKFLDAGIQDASASISKVFDLIERYPGDGDEESDKHI